MNIQIKILAALFVLCASCTAKAQIIQLPHIDIDYKTLSHMDALAGFPAIEQSLPHGQWGAVLSPVPNILRQHLRTLDPQQGLLITQVSPFGHATLRYGLASGDIVLQIGKQKITNLKSLPAKPSDEITILRKGEVVTLKERPMPWGIQAPMMQRGVTARAFAGSNESVSVSSNGNQVSVQMSLGEYPDPIRFQGTRQKVLADVKSSNLPPAIQQRVLDAIR